MARMLEDDPNMPFYTVEDAYGQPMQVSRQPEDTIPGSMYETLRAGNSGGGVPSKIDVPMTVNLNNPTNVDPNSVNLMDPQQQPQNNTFEQHGILPWGQTKPEANPESVAAVRAGGKNPQPKTQTTNNLSEGAPGDVGADSSIDRSKKNNGDGAGSGANGIKTQTTATAKTTDLTGVEAAGNALYKSYEEQGKAEQEAFKVEQERLRLERGELANLNQQMEAKRAADMMRVESTQGEIDKAVTELSSTKVDPDRFFNQRGTGDRILAAISVALGTYGSAMTGADNVAFKMIQNAIDRDVDAQKTDIVTKRAGLQEKRNMLHDMEGRLGGDRDAAEKTLKAAAYQRIGDSLMVSASKAGNEVIKAKYKTLADQAYLEKERFLAGAKETTWSTTMQTGAGEARNMPEAQYKANTAAQKQLFYAGKLRNQIESGEIDMGYLAGLNRKLEGGLKQLSPEEAKFASRLRMAALNFGVKAAGTSMAEQLRMDIQGLFPLGLQNKEAALAQIEALEEDANAEIIIANGGVPKSTNNSTVKKTPLK